MTKWLVTVTAPLGNSPLNSEINLTVYGDTIVEAIENVNKHFAIPVTIERIERA